MITPPQCSANWNAPSARSRPTPKVSADSGWTSIQPMGTLFEQSLAIFLDTTILRLMEHTAKSSDGMFTRHANLE